MKTKLLKSSLSILLVLLLCVSVMMPAVSAAEIDGEDIAVVGADGDVLEKHADSATVAKSDLQGIFGDSTSITNTAFYGYAPVPAEGTELDTSTIVYVSNSATITEGDWLALKTTAYTGSLLNRKPDWTNADKRSQLNFSVRTYYNATFSVVGCSDGALYLNNEAVDGQVRLYTDSTYTVTAQDVEGFTYEVTDVILGEEFTPGADLNVTATYTADASATVALSVGEGGSAKIVVDGSEVTDTVPAGKSFEVVAIPNDLKGYKLDSIVVTKDGEEVEAVDDEYGPVGDGEVYEVAVSFIYDPAQVSLDVDANDSKLERADLDPLFDGAYEYYGIAEEDTPDTIEYLYDYNLLITHYKNDYDVTDGKYIIYGTNEGSVTSPTWTNAKLMELTVRTYYNSTFTVTGNDDGEVYLNGETAVSGTKLYTDEEYTVTAKNIDEYTYTMEGAEDGVAFSPESDVNVTVAYMKEAYATFTVDANNGGTVTVFSEGDVVTDRVSEGSTFSVEAIPNENKGYKLDSVVVTKDGEEVEAVDGLYGPVGDGEEYAITVSFSYDPAQVSLDVNANDSKLERSDLDPLFGGAYSYYGIAEEDTPDTIVYLYDYNLLITHYKNDYDVTDGKYIIYGTNDGSVTSPNWTNAKLMELTVRTYYNSTFTVTGNEEGEVYLNGEAAVSGTKLYTDTEYTVTAKEIDDYFYTVEGAEDGVAFTPIADVNVTVAYNKIAYATFSLRVTDGGTAEVQVNGEAVTDRISEGDSFEVVTTPNANKGYKLDSIVVSKDGEEVEAVDGVYGPVADGEEYAITVTFVYDPPRVEKEVDANKGQVSRNDLNEFFDGAYNYYGIAPKSDPDNISYLAIALTSIYNVENGGEYVIYGSNDGNILSPRWTNAKLMEMTVRTYYNGTFTVTGNEDGEVYLNGEAIDGSTKLYVDTEYTVTAKEIDDYFYTVEGAEDGVAFTPIADVNVTVAYNKIAYATFSLRVTDGGTAEVQVNGEAVTDRISEGDSFEVVTTPNANKGYKLDSIVVSKDGEEVEPVDGVYGPAADGEEYAITVSFVYDPPRVSREVNANISKVSRSDLSDLFNGAYNYYGIAPASDPDNISYLAIALTSDYTVEEGVEYNIYGTNDGNILSPRWTNAKLMVMTARMYYNGTFTVSGNEDGEIYLNGESVEGTVKLFTDSEYTVTMKEIEHFICDLYGAEEGVPFTPTEDVEITASYMKEQYATLTVTANEGGTVEVTSDGEPVFDKIADESTFEVTITPDTENGYYVESWEVVRDGEVIEPIDGVYGPVIGGEVYEVNVTFEQATLTADDCEVYYSDIKNKDFEAVEATILANAEILPEYLTENAETKVEYAAYSLLGYDIYEPLDFTGALSHAFGTSSLGGELMDGNTEKIRITVALPDYDITLQAYATVTVRDTRKPTKVEGESITITYGDDLKAAVLDVIAVYDEFGEEIEFTDDDITVNPESLNANLLSAYRAQDVTVTYAGNDEYARSSCTVSVYVKQAKSSLDTKSETITYGETPAAKVITDPEDLDYIKVIAGIDGEAQGFVSIDIPESVKEKMQIKVGGVVVFDIYDYIVQQMGDGTTLDGFRDIIDSIYETVNSNEVLRSALEAAGFNMEALDSVMNFIDEIPEMGLDLKIRLGQVPTNTGAYLLFAVSTDTNYTVSADLSYIIIKPQSSTEDTTIELRFRAEMEGEEGLQYLSYEDAQEFNFGGDFYIDDVLTQTDKLHTYYVGTTFSGEVIAQQEPVTVPGIYTETVYMLGGNYWADPIVRAYTINRIETPMAMDDLIVPYDGETHPVEAYMEDGSDLPEGVTYTYVGIGYFSDEAPVNAGEYLVYAYYEGDDMNASASATAKLTIEKLDAVITVTCAEEVVYGDVSMIDISAADLQYTVSGTINEDKLGVIYPILQRDFNYPNVGEYTATAFFVQTNFNYNVTIEDAVMNIVPREVIVTIDDKEKAFGDEDPKLTYQVENLAFCDHLCVNLTREEGEDVGEYAITADIVENPNYTIADFEPGVFTITAKKITVAIDSLEKEVTDMDPEFTYTITDVEGNPVDPDAVGLTIGRDVGEKIGEYSIYVHKIDNTNYEIDEDTSSDGILTITAKKIIVNIDSCSKKVGEDDPEFTYTITDKEGDPVNKNKVGLTITRDEGEEPGTYAIYVSDIANTNYVLDEEASVNGILTIEAEPTILLGDFDGDGEVTSFDATLIQRYLAFMDIPYEINEAAGDVDGDGEITSFDATWIQRWMAYMDVPYPIGEYV